jgi:hypothetical protein
MCEPDLGRGKSGGPPTHPRPTLPPPPPAAPEFRKPVRAAYSFERLQPMRLVIYDVDQREKDNRKLKLDHQDFLGGCQAGGTGGASGGGGQPPACSQAGLAVCLAPPCHTPPPMPSPCAAAQGQFLLSDLLTAAGQRLSLPLSDKHGRPLPGCGAVLIAEQVPNTNAVVSEARSTAATRGSGGGRAAFQESCPSACKPCASCLPAAQLAGRRGPPLHACRRSSCAWRPPSWRTRTAGASRTPSCASPSCAAPRTSGCPWSRAR